MQVKEVSPLQSSRVSVNARKNSDAIYNYKKLIATAMMNKESQHILKSIRNRKDRLVGCGYSLIETYEKSKVKLMLRRYLCHDRFCCNCSTLKHHVMKNRYIPILEQHKDSLYHLVLTVPNCFGDELSNAMFRMSRSFKALVNYLNGNKTIKGLDLEQFGFQGCIRFLEVECNGHSYHPHYHVAAVFDNPTVAEDKHINNTFSHFNGRLFSDFESVIQRMWYLLINGQSLSYEAVTGGSVDENRYSCVVDKWHPDDYEKLFGYANKMRREEEMLFHHFRTLYNALYGVRQIQGYGIFYNIKPDTSDYTEQECTMLADFIKDGEEPTLSYEPLNRLANDSSYKIIKKRYIRS